MKNLSTGKIRGLQQLANQRGILAMCAVDHRESLKKMLNSGTSEAASYQDMVDFKLDLCRAVAPHASALLLDPIYGASQAIAASAIPGTCGLLVSIEATGYTGSNVNRITEVLPQWGVAKIKKMGASAVKLLIYYRPDLKAVAKRQLDLVKRLAEECIAADIPFLVETVSYPTEKEKTPAQFAAIKPQLVITAAEQVSALPIDVLKTEFPADVTYEKDEGKLLEICRQLNDASHTPWVLLSGGLDFEHFKKELRIACQSGASGFLAGRALWQEAVEISSRRERMKFLETTVTRRLKELTEVADSCGTSWFAKLGMDSGQLAAVGENWYKSY